MSRGRLKLIGSKFSHKRRVFAAVFIVLLAAGLFALGGQEVWAQGGPRGVGSGLAGLEKAAGLTITGLGASLLFVLTWIVYMIVGALGWLLMFLIWILVIIFSYNNFIHEPAVIIGWTIVRDFMNLFFIVALMVIAFATIFKIQAYHYKQMLPKLVIAAIVVNFSRLITGVLIDAAQVVMMTFVNAFRTLAGGNFAELFGISKLLSFEGAAQAITDKNASLWYVFLSLILAIVLVIVANAVVVVMIVMLAVRVVMLWMLAIFSPIAWVAPLLPGGEKYASQWWENLTKYLVTGVVMAFLVWLTFASLQIQNRIATIDLPTEEQQAAERPLFLTGIGSAANTFSFIIGIAMLLGSLLVAQQLGGIAGNFAGKMQGALAQGGKLAGRYTLGSLALAADKKFGFSKPFRAIAGIAERKKEQYHEEMISAKAFGQDIGEIGVWQSIKRGGKGIRGAKRRKEQDLAKEMKRQAERDDMAANIAGKGGEARRDELRVEVKASFDAYNELREQTKEHDDYKALKAKEKANTITDHERKKLEKLEGKFEHEGKEIFDRKGTDKAMQEAEEKFGKAQAKLYDPLLSGGSLNAASIKSAEVDANGKLSFKNSGGASIVSEEYQVKQIEQMVLDDLDKELAKKKRIETAVTAGNMSNGQATHQIDQVNEQMKNVVKAIELQKENGFDQATAKKEDKDAYDANIKLRDDLQLKKDALENYLAFLDQGVDKKGKIQVKKTGTDGKVLKDATTGQDIIKEKTKDEMETELTSFLTDNEDEKLTKIFAPKWDEEKKKEFLDELVDGVNGIKDLEAKIEWSTKPISEETRQKMIRDAKEAHKKADEAIKKAGENAKTVRGFYSKAATRAQYQEEFKKIADISNTDELLPLLDEAIEKKDKYKVGAIWRKAAENSDDNEILNHFKHTSNYQGFKDHFEKDIWQNGKGVFGNNRAEMMELASDMSFINESRNHWETARNSYFDKAKGRLEWLGERGHVKAAMGELRKKGGRDIARMNRLGLGGEDPNDNFNFKISPLGMSIMATFPQEIARFIQRGETDPNLVYNLNQVWDKIERIPAIRNQYYMGRRVGDWVRSRGKNLGTLDEDVDAGFKYGGGYY